MAAATGRRPSSSTVETTHLVLPPDTNTHGTLFGGRLMQWMDIAAGISAGRHHGGAVVTAAVDELVFSRPIRMADVVVIKACVNYAHRSSMEVGVRVEREDPNSGVREHCLSGYFTFVAVDDAGGPVQTRPLTPQTDIENSRFENARRRRQKRLDSRG